MEFENAGPGENERCEEYSRTLAALGVATQPEWVLDTSNAAFTRAAKKLPFEKRFDFATARIMSMRINERPTAWVGCNDYAMVALMRRMRQMGARVPEDLSLVGVDDSPMAALLVPTLTSVSQPLFEMGKIAATRLIERAEEGFEKCPHMFQKFSPALQARESSSQFKI